MAIYMPWEAMDHETLCWTSMRTSGGLGGSTCVSFVIIIQTSASGGDGVVLQVHPVDAIPPFPVIQHEVQVPREMLSVASSTI
jgi:hypothetical protein